MFKIFFTAFFVLFAFHTGNHETAYKSNAVYSIQLIEIVGHSPKVFDKGWTFGVKCLMYPGTELEKNVTSKIHWTGTGKFFPEYGPETKPVFSTIGKNEIVLTCNIDGYELRKTVSVETVNSDDYAAFGDEVYCASDSHGCPSCPHQVKGYISEGSFTVFIGEKPAARVGDGGFHMSCCGSQRFKIITGDENVLIDGLPAARLGDKTEHCGGFGSIVKLFREESE